MAKRVFFSFHYQDVIDFRANVVRQHWVAKPDREEAGYFDASIWEKAKRTSDAALIRLINDGLENTSATCILVGSETYARPWVRYEIIRSVWRGNRTLAVHINGIKGKDQQTKVNGPNPLDYLALKFSQDGKSVEVMEAINGTWISYQKFSKYDLKDTAAVGYRGKLLSLTAIGNKAYNWIADDGYNQFSNWVE